MQAQIAEYQAGALLTNAETIGTYQLAVKKWDSLTSSEEIQVMFEALSRHDNVISILGGSAPGGVVILLGRSKTETRIDLRNAGQLCKTLIHGKGGGSPDRVQLFGSDASRLDDALDAAKQEIKSEIEGFIEGA